ncbi:MAG: hypothetical protein ACTSUV_00560 [Candidatus Ranarchaeia archaeon]
MVFGIFGDVPINLILIGLSCSFISLISSVISLKIIIPILKKRGISGKDVHKHDKPIVAEMGGIGLLIGLLPGLLCAIILLPEYSLFLTIFGGCIFIGGTIGAIDDIRPLKAWQKPLLMMLPALLIYYIMYVLPIFWPTLFIPVVGMTRLTIVYPLLIPLAFTVCGNTVNMMDVMNGTMSGSMVIGLIILTISSFILGSSLGLIFSIILAGGILGLFIWNKYPSKVFCGDTGALAIGSGLACIAIMGELEVIAIIVLLPFIMNAFHSLASIGGLIERRDIKARPILLVEEKDKNGQNIMSMVANPEKGAPLTLTRLLLAQGPLTEKQIILCFFILTIFSGILALSTSWLIVIMGV